MYILIVIISTMYNNDVKFQEFRSFTRCEQAKQVIQTTLSNVVVECTRK